ncbi:putative lysine-specific histone demethylase 1A [Calycina marina]|uniref:Lysine-specific histone demethylase 1A n=1 Tax=Calycina marina TaxID=1763456 RepID=A0A9P7ZBN6_9HELO|nr:putative lysine-specific histone demethylase 1A [Calycina marina]
MAPSIGFDPERIKDKAKKDLLYLLEGIRGKKNVVLEQSLAGPLNLIVTFPTLQDYGTDKVFFLENDNADVSQRNVVFIARGENAKQAQLIADLLSLELDESFADLYLRSDPTPTYLMARALMLVQQKHGLFPRITGKGDNAKKLADLLARMRQELIAGEDTNGNSRGGLTHSATTENLIIIDREIDYATPLLTQLTYEGLVDEIVGIKNNRADVDTAIVGAAPQAAATSTKPAAPASAPTKKRNILLDSSDKLYAQLRDTNFAIVGGLLNKVARRLQTDYDSRHTTKTTPELAEFVKKLPAYQAEQQSLKVHTGLAEDIMKHTRTEQFSRILEVQQNLAAGADPSTQHNTIEELISRDTPLTEVLRLLCLESCISGGIKPRELENFKRMILQAYGYQHLLTLNALEKLQLLLSRTSPLAVMIPMTGATSNTGTKTNYTYLRKALRLIVDEVNEHDPNDIAYKQYVTSIIRSGNANNIVLNGGGASTGWFGFEDAVKHVRGQTFDELQKGEDKAAKARALLSGSGEKKTVFVVFLGGITFTEVAALRFIAKKEEGQSCSISANARANTNRSESARNSMTSSSTDHDDKLSSLSSLSSKATSPTDFGSAPKEEARSAKRRTYNVRPKVSIPADLIPSEYARQCISAGESSRLNPYALHPEEHSLLRRHINYQQVTTYLNIRNGILRLWVRNPLIGVMLDEAVGCAKDARWFDIANVCYEWLVRRGYINYGCLENLNGSKKSKRGRPGKRKRKTVVVIGAGMSGLGCARQLEGLFAQYEDVFLEKGEDAPQVIMLEGRDRVGGRVYSRGFQSKPKSTTLLPGSRYTAEMGGMIITGFDRGNPLNIIVRGQLALPYHALKPDTTIYDATGMPVDAERDQHAEQLFNYILDRVSEYKFNIPIPSTAEGDKDLLDAGRELSGGDGFKSILELEEGAAAAPDTASAVPQTQQMQMVPVSSDRLTGRAHLEPGVPAVHTAAFRAQEIGWKLRPGIGIEQDLDLEAAVRSQYATLGSVVDEAIRQFSRIVDFAPLDLRLINWHVANLEYSNATTCNTLSLGGWDLDAGNEWEGKHTMVTGGYQQPLTVRRRSNVKRIAYSTDQANSRSIIECENGEVIEADYVVSSVPLGVLKKQTIQFEPPLPDFKLGAIQRIGFGILNKVVLIYEEPFWDQGRDIFGTLRDPVNRFSVDQTEYMQHRGRFFQWFNCTKTSGVPALLALMAGDAAFYTEKTSDTELVEEATKVLKSVFGFQIPQPKESLVTRWGHDSFAYGSYSYTGAKFQPDDYEEMAKPIGNLFFAGEHTCGTHPATVHGAYISGLRAASEVLDAMIGPIEIPEPLIQPKESKRKSETALTQLDPRQERLNAYEFDVWNHIYTILGDRPYKPLNNYANPYRIYSKEKWEEAKRKCDQGRRPGKGKPISNEVKKMVTKMWTDASETEKKPYNDTATAQKQAYAAALAEYNEKSAIWDKDALNVRAEYEKTNPSVPGLGELPDSPSRRDRKAKRVSGYAENDGSGSEMEI